MKYSLGLTAVLVASCTLSQAIEYEADILPIFQARCAKCHLDGNSKGGVSLDLDRVDREIGSSKAIVPGETEKSDLFEVISLPDDDGDKMPPEGKGRPLTAAEIAKVEEWIQAGAQVGEMTTPEPTEPAPSEMTKRPDPIDGNWTNTSGKTISATLVRVDGNNAILRMRGRDYPYPITNLNADGQKIVREFADAWNKADGR